MHVQLEPILAIAREAGAAIMQVYAREFRVRRKADNSPVTEADSVAHRIIIDRLQSEYPGTPVMSEEAAELAPYELRRAWKSYWLVDPLDGTREFVKRNGQFTVNLAYIEDGRPVAGVVFAPAREWMYWGSVFGGAFKASAGGEGVPIACGPMPQGGLLRVVGSNSHLSPETRAYIATLRSRYDEISFVTMGSSLKICLVAEGRADLYPRLSPTMEWDTAAAHAVLNAAGGRLLEYGAEHEVRYNKRNLLNHWFIATPAIRGDVRDLS